MTFDRPIFLLLLLLLPLPWLLLRRTPGLLACASR